MRPNIENHNSVPCFVFVRPFLLTASWLADRRTQSAGSGTVLTPNHHLNRRCRAVDLKVLRRVASQVYGRRTCALSES